MSDIAIRVEGLGKEYRIGRRERYRTLRDTITDAATAPFRKARSLFTSSHTKEEAPSDLIWALKDVSFEVPRGSVVGVIGRNGAGKSTLLKVLSRITGPTLGRIEIHGRVGSLLEVGTGFHGELSGRENIFLNGAILGMRRAEVQRKFDEIVAFAEVEKFIDTPVKHYSSGMYMRLAFAVAAHLEPEILIIDEVLAVGDAQFQRKCLGKMEDVAKEGRTVVFVSHQTNQIRRLCDTCLWLGGGALLERGKTNNVISLYEESFTARVREDRASKLGGNSTRFVSWNVGGHDSANTAVESDLDLSFRFQLCVAACIAKGTHGIALFDNNNLLVWAGAFYDLKLEPGEYDLHYEFPFLPVTPGTYRWQLSLYEDGALLDIWDAVPVFRVHTPLVTHRSESWQGVLNLPFDMRIHPCGIA